MKEQTGTDYQSSDFANSLVAADAKMGKTMFILGSLLGILPWQKKGGVISKPRHLHVLTFDAGALSGFRRFALESCKASEEALGFRVYNMQEDLKTVATGTMDYDRTFFNSVMSVIQTVRERVAQEGGVHALHISSLTGMVEGLLRSVSGPAAKKKGGGMDQSKWGDFAGQVADIRSFAALGQWHTIWEAHIWRPPATGQNKDDENVPQKETLMMPGKSGQNFPYNVEQVFRVRREFNNNYEGSPVDFTYLDTKGSLDFISGGRNFTEALKPQEPDMTRAFMRLGLKVGHWGAPPEKPEKKPKK